MAPLMFRTGRLPHSVARLAAVPPHVMAAETPPPLELPRPGLVWTPTLARNDVLASCCVAGLVNSLRLWCLAYHGFDLVVSDDMLIAFFCEAAGCDQTEAAMEAVPGLVMLDVLELAQRRGFDVGAQAPYVPEFKAIDPHDMTALRDAVATQTAYVGVTLYRTDLLTPLNWNGTPIGDVDTGHCLVPGRYSTTGFVDATWGQEVPCDDDFLLTRIDECYAVRWTLAMA